jgi:pimeloyl-ACP methyl ester carboxylesterase
LGALWRRAGHRVCRAAGAARFDSAKITLRIARAPAVDAAKRRGVLLLLPGGPGAGIMEMMGGEMRAAQHKPTQAEFEAVARANAAFIKSCADASGELLWHLTAKDTAQDVDRIRQAVSPSDGIVSYAASYGSAYGAAYLEAYPENVKALILDGVVDHTTDFATFLARNVMSVQDAFERFARWCAQDAKCELHGKDLGAAFDVAITREPKTRTLVPQLLATGDHPELGWPALAHMLAEVGRGESKLLKEMTATATLSTADDPWLRVGKDGLFRAVMCADYGPQRDYAKLAATADTLAAAAPRFVWKFWDSMPVRADVEPMWRVGGIARPACAIASPGRGVRHRSIGISAAGAIAGSHLIGLLLPTPRGSKVMTSYCRWNSATWRPRWRAGWPDRELDRIP